MVWALLARALPVVARAIPSAARVVGTTFSRASTFVVGNAKNIVSWLIPGYTIGSAVTKYNDSKTESSTEEQGHSIFWPVAIVVGALLYKEGAFDKIAHRRTRGLSL